MTSDHFPIEASISMGYQLENKSEAKKLPSDLFSEGGSATPTTNIPLPSRLGSYVMNRIRTIGIVKASHRVHSTYNLYVRITKTLEFANYKKANWQLFSEILNSQIVNITESSLTIDQLNEKITEKIISASHKSIPYLSQKIYKTSLPPNIVNLIKERRK
ncbi:hypothetical protein BpHYR1_028910, partial [Brachionus plicatilis]